MSRRKKEQGYLDYRTLAKAFDAVLNKESDYMKEIEVNNGCKIILVNKSQCIEIIHCDSYGGIEYSYNIPDGDLVMLLNYYRNCKSGREKSDYIPEGKIRNTNTDIVEYI